MQAALNLPGGVLHFSLPRDATSNAVKEGASNAREEERDATDEGREDRENRGGGRGREEKG